jgi:hypothetical protein
LARNSRGGGDVRRAISGMTSLLDPLPDEGQQLVDVVARAYVMTGKWPVWQYVAQQVFGKHGVDAEAALRKPPRTGGRLRRYLWSRQQPKRSRVSRRRFRPTQTGLPVPQPRADSPGNSMSSCDLSVCARRHEPWHGMLSAAAEFCMLQLSRRALARLRPVRPMTPPCRHVRGQPGIFPAFPIFGPVWARPRAAAVPAAEYSAERSSR